MASNKALNPTTAQLVVPIICIECGNNAHCIRREVDRHDPGREHRAFECATCHRRSYRVIRMSESDAAVQKEAERMTGWAAV